MFFWRKQPEAFTRGCWIKMEPREEDVFVRLSGNLNQTLNKELREVLRPLLTRPIRGAIVLQLSNVHFIDTTIAAAIISFVKQAEQRDIPVEIWDASPVVNRVFAGLGSEKYLKISQEVPN